MTNQNLQRTILQNKAVALSKLHRSLALEYSTGCGKTLAAMRIVEDIIKDNPDAVGVLVCKESNHLNNWCEDITKHNKNHIWMSLGSILYASLHRLNTGYLDYIILDECHALTDKRVDALKRLIGPNTKLIFLSATIPYEKKILVQQVAKGTPHYDSITLVNAIDMGLLPSPKVIVHNASLVSSTTREYKYQHH